MLPFTRMLVMDQPIIENIKSIIKKFLNIFLESQADHPLSFSEP